MLCVKLHKTPIPWLGKGSYVIPIGDWRTGDWHVRQWIRTMTTSRRVSYRTNKVNYITLVRIPDDTPVELICGYGASSWIKALYLPKKAEPVRDLPAELKRALTKWWDAYLVKPAPLPRGLTVKAPSREDSAAFIETLEAACSGTAKSEPGGPIVDEPRFILGRALPQSCVKWTKDIRLLYGRRPPRHRNAADFES
jgi:hypothetical protein